MSSSETTSVPENNHSFNERKEDNYRRNSFEDRFCDDLSEVLLQFLSPKDKFRLECVSKQFQRTVFQRLYELDLYDWAVCVTQILKTLAKKFQRLDCLQKLETLSLAFRDSDLRGFWPQLKAFPALKRLDLWTDINGWNLVVEQHNQRDFGHCFTFEAFEGLSNITHLTLDFNSSQFYATFFEGNLKDIDINLPNLHYLQIKDKFNTTLKGVTQMADILSRLSRLETLKLQFRSGVDFMPIREQITEKCRKIKKNRN